MTGLSGATSTGVDVIFEPRSVALVGASDVEGSIGNRLVRRLMSATGLRSFFVTPRHQTISGRRAYPSLADVPEPVDLVLVATRAEIVIPVLREAVAVGSRAAMVFAAGFGEAGETGKAMEKELRGLLSSSSLRMIGPNTLGAANLVNGFVASFNWPTLRTPPGEVAVISQSGAIGTHLSQMLDEAGVGISYFAATGNELDVSFAEVLEHVMGLDEVRTCICTFEALKHPERLSSGALQARSAGKHIIALQVGSTSVGRRAALSHTASIATEPKLIDAFLRRHDIFQVSSLNASVDVARVLATGRRPGRRIGILTGSGGMGILAADSAKNAGLDVPLFDAELQADLAEIIPSFGSTANPVDWTAQAFNDASMLEALFTRMDRVDAVDAVFVTSTPVVALGDRFLDPLARMAAGRKLVVAVAQTEELKQAVTDRGVLCFTNLVQAAQAVAAVVDTARAAEIAPASSARNRTLERTLESVSDGAVLEHNAKQLLKSYGGVVTTERLVTDSDAAVEAAREIGLPVVLKLHLPGLLHKSEVGAVRLHLGSEQSVRQAWSELESLVPADVEPSMLVQEMVRGDFELFCGMQRHRSFGPVITVGLGGYLIELVGEAVLELGGLTSTRIDDMLGRLCEGRLLKGRRSLSESARAELASTIASVDAIATACPEIIEIDVNPIVVGAEHAIAVDALMIAPPTPSHAASDRGGTP